MRAPCDEGVVRSLQPTSPCTRAEEPWILAAAILGSTMAFIDGTVVGIALPALQKDLATTLLDAEWAVEAYALFVGALILAGGALGDRLGRARIFLSGVLIFEVASIGSGLAPTVDWLIAFRAVQGVGGALLIPGSLALIGASFPEERRGQAIGTWSALTAIATAVGPVLGGWLVDHLGWRWVFFVNVPLAVLVLLICLRRLPESRDESAQGADIWGAVLATVGLGSLTYGLVQAGSTSLNIRVVLATLAIGATALVAFVAVEQRVQQPMIPLRIFRSRPFAGANVLTFVLYGGLSGALFLIPFNLIQVQGYSATAAGAALLPSILLMFLLSRWAGAWATRVGARWPLTIGPLIAAAGFALLTVPGIGGSYWTTFFAPATVIGLGMALTVAPLTTVVMSAVSEEHTGVASGINNAVARVASLVAVAVFGLVITSTFAGALSQQLDGLGTPADLKQRLEDQRSQVSGLDIPADISGEQRVLLQRAVSSAYVGAFRIAMLVAATLALAGAGVAWKSIPASARRVPSKRAVDKDHMTRIQHVELDALHPGMSVLVDSQTYGRLVTVEPQPDDRHVSRLITRRTTDGKLVEVPIDWVNYVEADHVQLVVHKQDLSELPEYVPDLVDSLSGRRREKNGSNCKLCQPIRKVTAK